MTLEELKQRSEIFRIAGSTIVDDLSNNSAFLLQEVEKSGLSLEKMGIIYGIERLSRAAKHTWDEAMIAQGKNLNQEPENVLDDPQASDGSAKDG